MLEENILKNGFPMAMKFRTILNYILAVSVIVWMVAITGIVCVHHNYLGDMDYKLEVIGEWITYLKGLGFGLT